MKIAGVTIHKGESRRLNLDIAKLTSGTLIEIPVFVHRGKKQGPVLLLMAGLHGDEINSVDVVREILQKGINQVDNGTVICVPILNVFGFINFSREVPDGKDVNRSFPGFSKGSLASQIAHKLTNEILPHCDYIVDFHTGAKSRFNSPQTRAVLTNDKCAKLAQAFNAPFTLHSHLIKNSLREIAFNQGKATIVYEGGEALRFDSEVKNIALIGTKKIIQYLKMRNFQEQAIDSITLHHRKWLRAPSSGFFHPTIKIGEKIKVDQIVGMINGPFGDYKDECLAKKAGFVISLNNNPLVNRGDALMQIAYN